jgi:hypothetical protein
MAEHLGRERNGRDAVDVFLAEQPAQLGVDSIGADPAAGMEAALEADLPRNLVSGTDRDEVLQGVLVEDVALVRKDRVRVLAARREKTIKPPFSPPLCGRPGRGPGAGNAEDYANLTSASFWTAIRKELVSSHTGFISSA